MGDRANAIVRMLEGMKKRQGRCHQLAGRYMIRKGTLETKLIHGIFTGGEGRYHHWWIEEGSKVLDPIAHRWFKKSEYYRVGLAEPLETYTKSETICLTFSTGHFGPWTEIERKILNNVKGKKFIKFFETALKQEVNL